MSRKSPEEDLHSRLTGEAIRAVRQLRRMRPAEVAAAMGLPVRTYEHLEAGKGRISYHRLLLFAEATSSDAFAISAAVAMKDPQFAVRCADNKLAKIMMIAMSELNDELGPDIVYVESGLIIGAMTRISKELVERVRRRDTFAETWLEQGTARIHAVGRKPIPE
ncbi:helix-turn-helix domain-containing protein [Sphingobium boeckii]|uniref:helix-turn-helix domain-containing protein n=1 Tax=Sphingobium boeckii TaxID=1082345 RepID=UPI002483FEA5|nr:helix-turn-helix transcriptional regulator [Sphingobium boeckii]